MLNSRNHMQFGKLAFTFMLLAVASFSHLAHAQSQPNVESDHCDDVVVKSVGKHFHLRHFAYPRDVNSPSVANGGLIVAGTCKPWPTDTSKIIAAFAYDAGEQYEKQLLLAIVDSQNNRVMASYKGEIDEDALREVRFYSLSLDTARYTLSKTTRAFGLRMNVMEERCGFEGGSGAELTLFVVDGPKIRPVLTETMSRWVYGEGNRCGGDEVSQTQADIVISVEPTSSNGFADLRLTAKRSDKKKPLSRIIKYNGERYDLEKWSKAFDAWWE